MDKSSPQGQQNVPTTNGRAMRLTDIDAHPTTLAGRLWSHVDKRGVDECWPWQSDSNPARHPVMKVKIAGKRTNVQCSRLLWMLLHGSIDDDALVLHTCWNCRCMNPSHLHSGNHGPVTVRLHRIGVYKDSPPRGEKHPNATIDNRQAIEVMRRLGQGERAVSVARGMGIGYGVVRNIKHCKAWQCVRQSQAPS